MDHIKNIEKLGNAMNAANDRVNHLIDTYRSWTDECGAAYAEADKAADAFEAAVADAERAGVKFQLKFGENCEFRKCIAI